MRIKVNINDISLIDNLSLRTGEYKSKELEFIFSKEFENLVKYAVFINEEKEAYKVLIQNNKCFIASEVLNKTGVIILGVYGYEIKNNELILRYSPSPLNIVVKEGSFVENAQNTGEITPSMIEVIENQIHNIKLNTYTKNNITYIELTDPEGKTTISEVRNGQTGPQGPQGPKGDPGETQDLTDYVKNTDYATNSKGGVIKTSNTAGSEISNEGVFKPKIRSYAQYLNDSNALFISKGTLENVIAEYYKKQVILSQSEYDQITPDSNTLYFITD